MTILKVILSFTHPCSFVYLILYIYEMKYDSYFYIFNCNKILKHFVCKVTRKIVRILILKIGIFRKNEIFHIYKLMYTLSLEKLIKSKKYEFDKIYSLNNN